ncbi:MAG TPA: family 1 glycosylhydrolase, partial [Polyangiaceae bacterium]
YFDQLELSGHSQRVEDLDLIAGLGISALRYPVLWERVERSPGRLDFTWSDERMARLRGLAVEPIVGLVHHGSGPLHTSLVSSCFAEKLATFAHDVASRYPWVRGFTPVNEPLTTARFSALYGHWHPHARDDRSFVRALLNQCRAIALSMAAIRRVNPHALLVQTEDMGFTRSTERLSYQADFENERRWLSLDLLGGRVARQHALYSYLLNAGATPQELEQFEKAPCSPGLIGINYYVTSERFLDHRVARYPAKLIGGNARDTYVDAEAVRVCAEGILGPAAVLRAAYERYGVPVAITEAHIGCTADQRASWLSYVWRSALEAREKGADVRAVTAWALLGAHGWDQLVTRPGGTYEPGVFELVQGNPQDTDVAAFVRRLARGENPDTVPGWWTEDRRLIYPPHVASQRAA